MVWPCLLTSEIGSHVGAELSTGSEAGMSRKGSWSTSDGHAAGTRNTPLLCKSMSTWGSLLLQHSLVHPDYPEKERVLWMGSNQ